MNSLLIERKADAFTATVEIDGHKTIVDLAAMACEDRRKLVNSLFDWARRGYVGYPEFGVAA